MKHEIVYTDDYAVIVSDKYILPNTYILHYNKIHFCVSCSEEEIHIKGDLPSLFREDCKKVIAHRPLTDAPILEGLDMLPDFGQEDNVVELALRTYPFSNSERNALITGYNKAKETYKYTEEDLLNAIELAQIPLDYDFLPSIHEVMQSFKQSKRPKTFLIQARDSYKKFGDVKQRIFKISTITNSQGQKELVGTYEGGYK